MTFVISGATGFIGLKLIEYLLAEGHAVHYLARKRSDKIDSRAAFHCWDYLEEPPMNSVPRSDAVIHLAGEPISQRWTDEVKKRIYDSRVQGTRLLVSAIAKLQHKPSTLVCASAIGYYGDRLDEVLTESSNPGSGFLSDVCVDWEREAQRATESGLRVSSVRIGVVLGREGGALKEMRTPFQFGVGGTFGDGKAWMSWIHVQDLVRLLVWAAQNDSVNGPVNGTSPKPVTNKEFTKDLAHALHRPAMFRIPRFALKVALGEFAAFLTQSARVVPAVAEQGGFEFQYPELSRALGELLS